MRIGYHMHPLTRATLAKLIVNAQSCSKHKTKKPWCVGLNKADFKLLRKEMKTCDLSDGINILGVPVLIDAFTAPAYVSIFVE
jgi:hypothetical protein